ncbi:hypothetical protein MFIFM68171_10475 [Madurella fahalii]|uniref:Uncharacterized protein n=1 Tax=Madurella fahalii TaxID=1157608 RepID=A0ABQ0GR97_9PEZI
MSETITSVSSPSPPTTYATVSFHKRDMIRLINFPEDISLSLQPVIVASWPPGLESSGPSGEAYEFKVKGKPFGQVGGEQAVGGIRLLRNLFAFLHDHAWELVTPLMCSRRYTAKDTLIFRQLSPPPVPPSPMEWLALAPMRSDRLRVIYDAPDVKLFGVDPDHDYLGVLITSIKRTLEGGDWFDKGDWSHDSFEFKLKGRPWLSRGEASNKTRILLLRLLETMEGHGWKLHTAVLQRAGTDDIRITDTWYFVRERKNGRKGLKVA